MICRIGLLYVIEWLVVLDQATAYMSRCVGGMCFISSPPDTNRISWDSADQWCRNNGTRLIEITNGDIQNAMSSFLNDIRNTYNYNGVNLFTNGKRNAGSWTWVTGNTASYPWNAVQSDLSYGYVQRTTSGVTISSSRAAETKQGYICENESQCTNTTGVMLNSRCYRSYNNEALSWYDARMRCLGRGGDLALFDFINDNQGLNVLNGTWLTQQTTYLVGLRREWWTWQKAQADVKYSNWLSGHPGTFPSDPNDCLCLEPSQWKWVECRCGETKPFICMSEVPSSSTTTTTTTTTSTSKSTPKLDILTATSASVSSDGTNSSENAMPTTLQSSSTSAIGAESEKQRADINTNVAIGVGVGVGGGVVVVAIAVVVAVIIIRKRRSSKRDPEKKDKKKKPKEPQPPDVVALQPTTNQEVALQPTTNQEVALQPTTNQEESPYVTVIRPPPGFDDTIAYDNADTDKQQTVYANLEILTMPTSADNSPGVASDTESSRPSSPSRLTETGVEVGHDEMNGFEYDTMTRA